jgi:hypothetical protein
MAGHFGCIGRDGEQPGSLLGRQRGASGHVGLRFGSGSSFINCLPFNSVMQWDIGGRLARNCRPRQIHSQTAGGTGKPKGVIYPLFSLLQFAMFMREGIELRQSNTYWCFADPGWALGTICTLTAPLLMGCTTVMHEGLVPFLLTEFHPID